MRTTSVRMDLVAVGLVIFCVFILSYYFRVFMFITDFFKNSLVAMSWIDEIISCLLVLCICLAVFSWRRLRELKRKTDECLEQQMELVEMAKTETRGEEMITKQLRYEIDQRKKLEAELNTKSQLLETIVNGIQEQIILLSKDFKILWANNTFLEQFGCKEEDLAGQYCYKMTHNRDSMCEPPNDTCPVMQVLKTGVPTKEIHVHEGSKGKFFSEVSAYPIKNKKGEIIEFVHIARDVTEQKKAEGAKE